MDRILVLLLLAFSLTASAQDITWHSADSPVAIALQKKHDKVVDVAAGMFRDDIRQVTGSAPIYNKEKKATIIVGQTDRATAKVRQQWQQMGIPVDSLLSHTDAFALQVIGNKIYAIGNNGRGAAYAMLELSRMAGVSPWIWWGDNTPNHRNKLTIATGFKMFQAPKVERRGIFINDEDWSILPWSHTHHDKADGYFTGAVKGRKLQRIGVKTYRELFKLLLRLRANMIWPAMHEYTVPFYKIKGALECADSCGIIIGTSHCEPLMRNNTTEWSVDERGAFNYLTNGENVRQYWTDRMKETSTTQNVYTIGMRGIHDGSMEGPKTLEEKTYWLQRVIDDQRQMIEQYINPDATKVPQAFVPYKEVLEIYENGLRVPDDVTLIWCDDNYGYLTRLPDAEQQKRSGGHGLYYHLSYWGRPHSYLWHTSTQPGLIYNELREAYNHNVRKQWIFNIHDPKVAAFDLELALNLAWEGPYKSAQAETLSLDNYTKEWFAREFGEEYADNLAEISKEYFRLASIRRPEFMGWNQIELDKRVVPGGKSPITDTEFSFDAFGDEADRYIEDYQCIVRYLTIIDEQLPKEKRDALFSVLGYRVQTAALMAEKLLEAQRARSLKDSTSYSMVEMRNISIAKVQRNDSEIKLLTERWNTMQNGRWRGLMHDHPQDLPVYMTVPLPYTLSSDSIISYLSIDATRQMTLSHRNRQGTHFPLALGDAIALKASEYSNASCQLQPVEQLGHSMSAIPLPKGEWMEWTITLPNSENNSELCTMNYELRVATLPTQANDKGDIRYAVSIDGGEETVFSLKEPYRSERWKQNVLRQQALRNIDCNLSEGNHTIRIRALDDHIVIDQIIIDNNEHKYYVIPTKK